MTSNKEFCRFLTNGLVIGQHAIGPCCFNVRNIEIENIPDTWDKQPVCNKCEGYRLSSFDAIDKNAHGITYLEISPSIDCNLACPMCDYKSSSTWYKEDIKFGRNRIYKSDSIWNLPHSIDLSNVTFIKIHGGEPLYHKKHLDIIKNIQNKNKVTLFYVSNFSIEPSQEVMDVWKKFKLIKWTASIDDIEHRFEYLRWPYKWKKLLSFKDKMIKTMPSNVMFGIETTITPLSIYYINDMIDWVKNEFSHNAYGDKVDFHTHFSRGKMGIDKIPETLYNEVKHRIDKKIFDQLSTQIDDTFIADNSALISYLDRLTNERNMDWRKIFPEIQHHFK